MAKHLTNSMDIMDTGDAAEATISNSTELSTGNAAEATTGTTAKAVVPKKNIMVRKDGIAVDATSETTLMMDKVRKDGIAVDATIEKTLNINKVNHNAHTHIFNHSYCGIAVDATTNRKKGTETSIAVDHIQQIMNTQQNLSNKNSSGFYLTITYGKKEYQFQSENVIHHSKNMGEKITENDIAQCRRDFLDLLGRRVAVLKKMYLRKRTSNKPENVLMLYCEGMRNCCPVSFIVQRFNNKFGYYQSNDHHIHQNDSKRLLTFEMKDLVANNIQESKLPSKLMASFLTCEKYKLEKVVGKHNVDLLNTHEGKRKIHNSLTNHVRYRKQMRHKLKNDLQRSSMDIKIHIANRSIDLKKIVSLSLDKNNFHLDKMLPDSNGDFVEYYTHSDYGVESSGAYTSIRWTTKHAITTIAKNVIDHADGKEIALQGDFLHSSIGDKGLIGIVGVTDARQTFHLICASYNKSESTLDGYQIMDDVKKIFEIHGYDEKCHGNISICLDGSKSLRAAANKVGYSIRRCDPHIFRKPDKSKGKQGYSGTAGSLYTFCQKHNCDEKENSKLRFIIRRLFYLDDLKKYKKARTILLNEYNRDEFYGIAKEKRITMKSILFTDTTMCYVPIIPEWGYAGTKQENQNQIME